MPRILRTAATGMNAQQLNVDTIANNIANVNTTGFKRSKVEFQDLLYQTLRVAGSSNLQDTYVPTEIQVGNGTRPVATQKIYSQGEIILTQNQLDMAINGDGFFQITRPDGTIVYTRDGAFKLSDEGVIVNSDGLPLEPQITVSPDTEQLEVGADGTIMAKLTGQVELTNLGQVELVKFINPGGLRSMGQNLYEATFASGNPIPGVPGGPEGLGTIMQRYLETSNVEIVEEMVNMIIAQRAYDLNSKAVQAADEMLNTANNLRR